VINTSPRSHLKKVEGSLWEKEINSHSELEWYVLGKTGTNRAVLVVVISGLVVFLGAYWR